MPCDGALWSTMIAISTSGCGLLWTHRPAQVVRRTEKVIVAKRAEHQSRFSCPARVVGRRL